MTRSSTASPALNTRARPAEREPELRRLILAETGTLGLRRTIIDKLALPRTAVKVDGLRIAVKRGPWGAKPEHDHLAAAAAALDLPLREVTARALAALSGPADV